MADYGLVSRSINQLADRIGRASDRQTRHEEAMIGLGLQGTKMDMDYNLQQQQQAVDIAKAKREKFLAEPITGKQAIMEIPNLTDEQRQAMLTRYQTDAPELLDMPFQRGKWIEGMHAAESKLRESKATADYRSQSLGLQREQGRQQAAYNQARLGLLRQQAGAKTADKIPANVKAAMDVIKQLKPERYTVSDLIAAESAMVELPDVPKLSPEQQQLYDAALKAVSKYYGVQPKSEINLGLMRQIPTDETAKAQRMGRDLSGQGDYPSAEAVKQAYRTGQISKDQAVSILQSNFGFD